MNNIGLNRTSCEDSEQETPDFLGISESDSQLLKNRTLYKVYLNFAPSSIGKSPNKN